MSHFLHRDRLMSLCVVWWSLFQLLITTSALTCLQQSRNHMPRLMPIPAQGFTKRPLPDYLNHGDNLGFSYLRNVQKMQFFHLIFTQPGNPLLVKPRREKLLWTLTPWYFHRLAQNQNLHIWILLRIVSALCVPPLFAATRAIRYMFCCRKWGCHTCHPQEIWAQ